MQILDKLPQNKIYVDLIGPLKIPWENRNLIIDKLSKP